ncbi:hypothetical protein [Glycomyces algeriensis]|uniref:hypothetical protein n=1 Tax=Glycomyces algeriensis TaxID=256037 RepID=UPI0022D294AC|nr:hypothetical protein [Glycomyces algeriensis]MDA1366610.1 hypothetical protein [Glycomyces algeriensis]MDR7352267.1 hypothetical protein [Glycomyces algeriensis]
MERRSTLAAAPAADPPAPRAGTAVSGWVLRATATLFLICGFAQPVFAGVYLTGDFDGLTWHVVGADLLSSLSIVQLGAAVAVWIRVRRAWPFWASLALLLGGVAQYFAGLDGALWLHLPLGVALIAGIAITFAALWMRPLPRRVKEAGTDA